ncbi:MAG: alpha/beta hydrolase [Chlorobi bacterium]|nr:alpha/beta hydrolase [Chlorobiota bacterium]MBX7215602.1 alpha/beta hydrolase [Candidatus Kapabacteria bacterium]
MNGLHSIRNGSGPPMVFVHGNPSTHTLWRPLTERLCDRFTVVAVDLPGFGKSQAPHQQSGFRLDQMAETLLRFCQHHQLERIHLVGHSFGAAVAATMGAMEPGRIRTLTLITPLGLQTPPVGQLAKIRMLRAVAIAAWPRLPAGVKGALAKGGARFSYGAAYHPHRAAEVARESQRHDLPRSMSSLMMEADLQGYRQALCQLNMIQEFPLLLIGAGRDRVVPPKQFQKVAELLPRARRHVFPNAGHVPMWQHPDEIERLIMDGLAQEEG